MAKTKLQKLTMLAKIQELNLQKEYPNYALANRIINKGYELYSNSRCKKGSYSKLDYALKVSSNSGCTKCEHYDDCLRITNAYATCDYSTVDSD
jgi:hypothetical protein